MTRLLDCQWTVVATSVLLLAYPVCLLWLCLWALRFTKLSSPYLVNYFRLAADISPDTLEESEESSPSSSSSSSSASASASEEEEANKTKEEDKAKTEGGGHNNSSAAAPLNNNDRLTSASSAASSSSTVSAEPSGGGGARGGGGGGEGGGGSCKNGGGKKVHKNHVTTNDASSSSSSSPASPLPVVVAAVASSSTSTSESSPLTSPRPAPSSVLDVEGRSSCDSETDGVEETCLHHGEEEEEEGLNSNHSISNCATTINTTTTTNHHNRYHSQISDPLASDSEELPSPRSHYRPDGLYRTQTLCDQPDYSSLPTTHGTKRSRADEDDDDDALREEDSGACPRKAPNLCRDQTAPDQATVQTTDQTANQTVHQITDRPADKKNADLQKTSQTATDQTTDQTINQTPDHHHYYNNHHHHHHDNTTAGEVNPSYGDPSVPHATGRQEPVEDYTIYIRDEDSDNESVEDISISQNVPNSPPPSRSFCPSPSPPQHEESRGRERRGVGVASEAGGGGGGGAAASGGYSREYLAQQHGNSGSNRLQLDLQKPLNRYQGHYTLACDVTPSPMCESVTMATTLESVSASSATTTTTANNNSNSNNKQARRHRKLPDIPPTPRKNQDSAIPSCMSRSIFDEIQEALVKEVTSEGGEMCGGEDDLHPSSSSPPSGGSGCGSGPPEADDSRQYPFIHKHMGHLFDKKRLLIGYSTGSARSTSSRSRTPSTSSISSDVGPPKPSRSRHVSASSVTSEAGAAASLEEEISLASAHGHAHAQARSSNHSHHNSGIVSSAAATTSAATSCSQERRRKNSDGDGSRRHASTQMATPYYDLEVTHRGMHRFIPRHADEVQIGIGDPIHVIREYDDLWCEGVNLRSGERGIFPAMYANDLKFLEESDGDDEHWKFTMRFLGAVEVTSSSGDFALCQAINKVAQQGRVKTASLCILEINQYGIRMIDKSKEGHESEKFTNFFALKNISFCGTHPSNNRYFAFITKHPREVRFACHVFHSDRSTNRARDALGHAFKRFYQEYMAFTHPTEDLWIE